MWRLLAAIIIASPATTALVGGGPVEAACADPSPGTPPQAPAPDDGKPLVFYGHGNGHGMGMSQYGARGAALLGCSSAQIVTTYYTGTHVATVDTTRRLDVYLFTDGLTGHRATVTVEPDAKRVATVSWRYRNHVVAVQPEGTTWTVKPNGANTRLIDHNGAVRFDRRATGGYPLRGLHTNRIVRTKTYRDGSLNLDRRLKYDAGQFYVTNGRLDARQNFYTNNAGVGMDKYLYGLGEVPYSWPSAALQAQVLAARTFAIRLGRPLRPTSGDQYYLGYDPTRDSPTSPWRQAVDATSSTIIADSSGAPIKAYYSASMGGYTEDSRYVWGVDEGPYIRAVDDSNWNAAANDPYLSWVETFTYAEIANTFGFDRVTAMSVARRGRASRLQGVKITGRINGVTVTHWETGWHVRQALGLRSPGFLIVTR